MEGMTVVTTSTVAHRHGGSGSGSSKAKFYVVRPNDTLSKIAERYYRNASDWPWLYDQNATTVRDPNLIYTGQTLLVPAHVPAGYVPRHAKPATTASSAGTSGYTSPAQ